MIKALFLLLVIGFVSFTSQVFAQESETQELFQEANEHFVNGEYKEAIQIYDNILEIVPNNFSTLKMKGVALSNLAQDENLINYHTDSLEQFYTIIQHNPNDVLALTGLGVGFGYLGEYHESKQYFEKALELEPDSAVIKNYLEFVDKVIQKYPYTPTEKPMLVIIKPVVIPDWVKNNAKWWSEGEIKDDEFILGIQFLIKNGIMKVDPPASSNLSSVAIPDWVKNNAGWWADDLISDDEFVSGIYFMIQNGIIVIHVEKTIQDIENDIEHDFSQFEKYLRDVSKNVADEKRYIEYPNPSFDVIKKFLRDYIKWNFSEEASSAAGSFPNPTYEIVNGTYVIHYKIFVNEQPSGLPLDHVSTFNNSLKFWQQEEFSVNEQPAVVEFSYTNLKSEANVWVTWVVRDLGEGVLGHAHLGKGVVEVALGDYECDGSFQLYAVESVEKIMTHELGHSVGLQHSSDSSNIMYPTLKPKYAYCLFS
ncbi:MAG: TPR repeat-containing protein [Marine Group I thaumarchaeote]|nr:MAG: TPR repeat-containing protein [Marine Group I thaumarchaeote]